MDPWQSGAVPMPLPVTDVPLISVTPAKGWDVCLSGDWECLQFGLGGSASGPVM